MATKSVAKSGAKPIMQYHKKASCELWRLPFLGRDTAGKPSFWNVPATGGYVGGCEFGKWAAMAYLKMLRAEKSGGGGYLQLIVDSMLASKAGTDNDSFAGQIVGFFSTLDHELHGAAKADLRLDDYSERDLASAMTRAVNFDNDAWDAALQKLQDMGGESVPYVLFHAYRPTAKPTAANEAEERAA